MELSGGVFSINVHNILAEGDLVVVLATVNAQRKGISASFPEVHVWQMKNGKAIGFREYQGDEQGDGTGLARASDFVQVELMKRDSKKYRSTAGWGWGRWLGPNLTPDAKTADLKNACIDCHTPLRYNDYVFTMPIKNQQRGAL